MEERKIAVLIDGENISHNDIDDIFQEIKRDGRILTARLYGSYDSMKQWQKVVNEYSIQLRTQFSYVTGKNTSDSALIIDAMDILYRDEVDTFYILSSDSDFTNLIKRIKESNKIVVGVGEKKTPQAVINACNKFIYIENLSNNLDNEDNQENVKETDNIVPLEKIYHEIYNMFVNSNKDVLLLSSLKNTLVSLYPDFDTKNYLRQPRKFSDFLKKIPGIEVYTLEDGTTSLAHVIDEDAFDHFIKGSEVEKAKPIKPKKSKVKNSQPEVEAKQNQTDTIEIQPTIQELNNFILEKMKQSEEGKLNLSTLHEDIKKEYKDKDFKIRNYGVSRFVELIKIVNKKFKFDAKKLNVYLKK